MIKSLRSYLRNLNLIPSVSYHCPSQEESLLQITENKKWNTQAQAVPSMSNALAESELRVNPCHCMYRHSNIKSVLDADKRTLIAVNYYIILNKTSICNCRDKSHT